MLPHTNDFHTSTHLLKYHLFTCPWRIWEAWSRQCCNHGMAASKCEKYRLSTAAKRELHADWNIRLWFMNRRRWPSRHWPSPRFSKSRRSGRRCPGTHQGKTWKVRKVKSQQDRVTIKLVQMNLSGWWYTYPSKKYEFVSWDDYSQYMEIIKKKVPKYQTVVCLSYDYINYIWLK